MARLLFGPCDDPVWVDQFLGVPLAEGRWAAFGARCPSYADAARLLPAEVPGGPPDAVAVWLGYAAVPDWVWAAPVPVVALAPDPNLLWSGYRHLLPRADLVLTDAPSAARLRRAGIAHVRAANLYGLDRHLAAAVDEPDGPRDIDVLFVGNLNPAVQGTRLPWLGRVAALADRYRVVIATGVFGAEYRALLRRSKLVFNRSVRGECNLRALEAAASGAVLLQEADNAEVAEYLDRGASYAPYTDADLEVVVARLLADDAERRRIADAARDQARWWTFEALVRVALGVGGKGWAEVKDRARVRAANPAAVSLAGRVWQRASCATTGTSAEIDETLRAELARANDRHALGVVARAPAEAEPHFAASAASGNRTSKVARAVALAALNRHDEALTEARAAVAALDANPELTAAEADSIPYPMRFDHLRVAWEGAGFDHPGDEVAERQAKARLLRARALVLVAELTGAAGDWERATTAAPEWPHLRAALGRTRVESGAPADAVPHLRAALDANPFDNATARLLADALRAAGQEAEAEQLVAHRAVLATAAPGLAAPLDPPAPVVPPGAAELVPVPEPSTPVPEPAPAPAPSPTAIPTAPAAPRLDELVSIIILCCNELDATRLCLESVLAHTRAPYELVLIDNGSTDDTATYLHSIGSRPGPARVTVAVNERNRGYPAGVNQGLSVARGDSVVLLNNDVVVTPHWLDKLVRCSHHQFPSVGLVGPTTNYAPPPQLVEPGYDRLADLDAFATRRAHEYRGQALDVPRLTGFCLLVRRAVFERIGNLDEAFGLGFFDDDDLCLRARRAGFRLALALDCYVHHFGSRTFRALGVDTAKLLDDNLALYQAKWGVEEAARYSRPGAPSNTTVVSNASAGFVPAVTLRPDEPLVGPAVPAVSLAAPREVVPAVAGKPRVSLTMIVRNEERNLPDCLVSVRDLVDEAVVCDTGSTDRTVAIAERFGCTVTTFPWVDHFAAARNAALDAATGDYAFWMDADDRLDDDNRTKLKALFDSLPAGNAAYVMKCLCAGEGTGAGGTAVDHVRLFRTHPAHRWTHRIHEQILPALRATGADVRWTDVAVRHVGYVDPALRRTKLDRDLRLLKLEEADQPDHPFTLFNLGSVYHELGRFADAGAVLARSLAGSHPHDSIVRKTYALLARCRHQGGDRAAAEATCRRGRTHYPDDAELLFLSAGLAAEGGDARAAEGLYRKLIDGREGNHFASVDTGLRAVKGRHNLAFLLLGQNRFGEAEGLWRAALTHDPLFLPAHVGLGELYARTNNDAGLDRQLAALEALGDAGAAEAAVLQSRARSAKGDHAGAAAALEAAIAKRPTALGLRLELSRARIVADAPPELLEAAFRGVLELDPHNAQARSNLALLYRKTGRSVEGIDEGR